MHSSHLGLRALRGNTARTLCLVAVIGLALTGCGGGGDGGEADATQAVVIQTAGTGAAVPRYGRAAPEVGDFWDYDLSDGGQDVQRVVGTTVVAGEQAFQFLRTGSRPGLGTATQQWDLVVRDGPDVTHARAGFDPLAAAFYPRRGLLEGPVRIGHRDVLTQGPVPVAFDYDRDGRNDTATLRIEIEVVATGPQTTPAGTFIDCMQTLETVTYTVTLSGGQAPLSKVIRNDSWFASGGGRTVRFASVTEESQQGVLLSVPTTVVGTLVGYKAGDLSGGIVR